MPGKSNTDHLFAYGIYRRYRKSPILGKENLLNKRKLVKEGYKKRLDRNPASCKIQYPMKNRDETKRQSLEVQ
jgi:hypothetical protein